MSRDARIKFIHQHEDGKRCYSRTAMLENGAVYLVNGVIYTGAYYPYTGHWYVWDEAGSEVASFVDYGSFSNIMNMHKVGELIPDPECVI